MNALSLRDATPDDLPALAPIYTAPINTHQLGFESVPANHFPALAREVGLLDGLRVATLHDTIVAAMRVARLSQRMSYVAELASVAVHPEHQGRGIARAMVTRTLDDLRAQGIRRVQLSVGADNDRGIAFWRAMGFEQEGIYRGYFRRANEDHDTDEIAMALRFTEPS